MNDGAQRMQTVHIKIIYAVRIPKIGIFRKKDMHGNAAEYCLMQGADKPSLGREIRRNE